MNLDHLNDVLLDCIARSNLKNVLRENEINILSRELTDYLNDAEIQHVSKPDLKKIVTSLLDRLKPPVNHMELFLTSNCNLKCSYCFVEEKNPVERMSFHTAKNAIDFLVSESLRIKNFQIVFFGGEPLLEFELMKKIIDYSRKIYPEKKFSFHATTNGLLLDEKILKYSKKHGLKLLISLDGKSETNDLFRKTKSGDGSFKHIIKKFSLIKQYQPWVGVRMTVHPDAAKSILEGVKYLYSKGVNQFLISPVEGNTSGAVWSSEALADYEEQLKKLKVYYDDKTKNDEPLKISIFDKMSPVSCEHKLWGCRAARNSVAVAPNGDIYPCSRFIGIKYGRKKIQLGNVFDKIIAHDVRDLFLDFGIENRKLCIQCKNTNYCDGGCPALNFEETGSIFLPSKNHCEFIKIKRGISG